MEHSPTSTIARYINTYPLAVLSTVNADGAPHGSTIYIGSDDELNIYFMTKSGTTKDVNIKARPVVALTLSGEDHQSTLQLSGTAHEINDQANGAPAFEVLGNIKRHSEDFRLPITKIGAGQYIVYKIVAEHAVLTQYDISTRIGGLARIEFSR
jgi:predicted pyridoxine 5'-phosphate oxidase superfamily flavin-nucleotide-binding protein